MKTAGNEVNQNPQNKKEPSLEISMSLIKIFYMVVYIKPNHGNNSVNTKISCLLKGQINIKFPKIKKRSVQSAI